MNLVQNLNQARNRHRKLPQKATLPPNGTVATAALDLYQHTYLAMNYPFVRAHEVTRNHPSQYSSAAQRIRSITWTTRPEFSEKVEAYARMENGNRSTMGHFPDRQQMVLQKAGEQTACN